MRHFEATEFHAIRIKAANHCVHKYWCLFELLNPNDQFLITNGFTF